MSKSDIIKEFITNNFLFGDSSNLNNDTDFFEMAILDSTGIIELVSFVEETFNISVEDDELTLNNFSSISQIVNYLQSKNGLKAP